MTLARPFLALTCALLAHAMPDARAACSRPIVAPAAPIGLSVVVRGDQVSGIFPDFLNAVAARAGCAIVWPVVPRARIEAMFENGSADMLIAAIRSEQRDRSGLFVPLLETRPTLVSLAGARPAIASMEQLLARRELRVALVRGFDYGDAYRGLSAKLAAQGRLYLEPDPLSVARLLHGGMADVTIMPPTAVLGAIRGDPRVEGMAARLRSEPLKELPWLSSGIYLSARSLGAGDRRALEKALIAARKSGALMQAYRRHYPSAMLAESTRAYQGPTPP